MNDTAPPPAASPRPRSRPRARRGHGEDLREEIIAAARDLMAAAPTADAVPIRAVATAAGVTAPSIYRHFADKQALVSAVVADVLNELDRTMVAAGDEIDDPLEKLRAFGMAYVQFALDYPEHYRLATMDPCSRPDVDAILAAGCWTHFTSAVQACLDAGIFPPQDPIAITLDLWAAAHGIAALLIAKPYFPFGEPLEATDRVLRAAAYGHTVIPGTWP